MERSPLAHWRGVLGRPALNSSELKPMPAERRVQELPLQGTSQERQVFPDASEDSVALGGCVQQGRGVASGRL